MDWRAKERIKFALPYGLWRWQRADGTTVETIFNQRQQAIASRVDGVRLETSEYPPYKTRPVLCFYGVNTNRNYPWRDRAVREDCRNILRKWGIDPDEHERAVGAALREERRLERRVWRR